MCWNCYIENLKAQTAKEDINVYKIVKKATKESCISPFRDYTYYSKDIQPLLTLGVTIKPCSIFAKITEGYHSYSSVNFVCDSIMKGVFGGYYVKTIQCGNRKEIFIVDNYLYLATFIIPKGSVYFTNEEGAIVSNIIRYTGKYLKL